MNLDTITVSLVKTDDGRYVGKTYSDRWNLTVLREDFGVDPNEAGFTGFRQSIKVLSFKLASTKAGTHPVLVKSDEEKLAMRPVNPAKPAITKVA